ncbi:MAG: tRNA pseudouridine(38,39,40) synthase TruA [Desulfobacterales bacterium S7086C20]|nr:MAG: tRNA pseudouridine(38,39,40) synthase TruA [Desulfobacterales bacterium S7086C20]
MRQNLRLTIEYDGTNYHGWQRQKNASTVQGTIEAAIEKMTEQSVTVIGSGRTDAGVHAQNQIAHFSIDSKLTSEIFKKGLNSLVPADIVIKDCQAVDDSFHARYDVSSKVYNYHILNRPFPTALFRHYAWHIKKELDLNTMREAMLHLKGTHDFSAFEATGSHRSNPVRNVMNVSLHTKGSSGHLVFSIEANGFLRCMVRNIVGTLVDIGLGKTSPTDFCDILHSKNRTQAGATAPSQGLFLKEVKYEGGNI